MNADFKDITRRSLDLLDTSNRRRVYLLLVLTFLSAAVEVIGIGSVAPFIAVLTNPDVIESNRYLKLLSTYLDIADPKILLFILGAMVIAISLTRNGLFLFHQRMNAKYLALFKHHISSQLLRTYLLQPYTFFLKNSSVELQRNVIEETSNVVEGVLQPIITGITKFIMCVTIVVFLVYLQPTVALVTLLILGGFYVLTYFFVHLRLLALSIRRREYRSMRFKLTSEGLNGIKPLILSGQRNTYPDAFAKVSIKNALADAKGQIISAIPRYGIESIALIGLISFAVFEFNRSDGQSNSLPLMALYLLAGYRFLPALQELYASVSRIKFDSESLNAVHEHLFTLRKDQVVPDEITVAEFSGAIDVQNVSYTYPEASRPAVTSVDLKIAAKSTVGFVGRSGSGKSTLVDLLLGLIQPQEGEIIVDGSSLNTVRSQWQRQIGYVPQQIYLADDSVASNIAFGIEADAIDHEAVVRAAKIADIHNHVVNELADGYDTIIGERGVKLSGGQCQRIGIARALYNDPSVLILDEATSALDRTTENIILDAIQRLSNDVTIILIAHRITTVEPCDQIYVLADGCIVGQGDYPTLVAESAAFRDLAVAQDG